MGFIRENQYPERDFLLLARHSQYPGIWTMNAFHFLSRRNLVRTALMGASMAIFSSCSLFQSGSLEDTKWLCNGISDESESSNLDFPASADNPETEGYFEVYGKDGSFRMIDPLDGEDLLGADVKASFSLNKDKNPAIVILKFNYKDDQGQPQTDTEFYEIHELSEKKYHSSNAESEGNDDYHESKCVYVGKAG